MLKAARIVLFALSVAMAFLGVPRHSAADMSASCSDAPAAPATELIYRVEAGEERVTPASRDEAIQILCERLRAFEIGGEIRILPEGEISVVLPSRQLSAYASRRLGSSGQLYFFDWEPNLIGRERLIGGFPGVEPPTWALKAAEREWRDAGRDLRRPESVQLLLDGALPTLYSAVHLASEQKPRARCAACSAVTRRFYLFDRSPEHDLLAGPVSSRAGLREASSKRQRHRGIVLGVPVGTAIAFERPVGRNGRVEEAGRPGWFALEDHPALTSEDIVDPQAEYSELHIPAVTFGLTARGRVAFQRLTRTIAQRGQARADGPVTSAQAEELSNHLALVFAGEVKTRPIIDFADNPDGIDGRTGAQISGGFNTIGQARDLAAILRIGALPVNLVLARRVRL
jgi:SecD/SecF fusion protein